MALAAENSHAYQERRRPYNGGRALATNPCRYGSPSMARAGEVFCQGFKPSVGRKVLYGLTLIPPILSYFMPVYIGIKRAKATAEALQMIDHHIERKMFSAAMSYLQRRSIGQYFVGWVLGAQALWIMGGLSILSGAMLLPASLVGLRWLLSRQAKSQAITTDDRALFNFALQATGSNCRI